jgi:SAM-dependent methyltransferase
MWSTPPEVYSTIAEYAKDKVFCDLGCGKGHILRYINSVARKIIGIDWKLDASVFSKLKVVGDNAAKLYEGDFTKLLPSAEVYYMWCGHPRLKLAQMDKNRQNIHGTLLIGAHGAREVKFLHDPQVFIPKIHKISFKEGADYPGGVFYVGVVEYE